MATLEIPVIALKNASAEKRVYRPELDALRFLAFLAVFCTHTMRYQLDYLTSRHIPHGIALVFSSLMSGGVFGVDLFFVLSAYLITDLLLREKETFGRLHIKAFYVRRILRIWPLYFFFLGLVLLVPQLDRVSLQAHYTVPFLLFVGNWSFVLFGWVGSAIVPLWSVSVEEQFYAFWPPIVARLGRTGILWAAGVMIVIANISRAFEMAFRHSNFQHLWGNTFAHLDSLGIGIIIAVLLHGELPKFKLITRAMLIVSGVALIGIRGHYVLNEFIPQGPWGFGGYYLSLMACGFILLAFLGLNLRSPALQYLGKISYGLYVYHLMVFRLLARVIHVRGVRYEVEHISLALIITIAVSAISYELLEKRFIKLKDKFTFVRSRPA